MKTHEFFSLLESHKNKSLLFEYAPEKWVGANYHITEIKHVKIDSVDCGRGTASWNETLIQLWESPSEKDKKEYMSTFKALGILKKVAQMKPFDMEAELKFEYSNDNFHTAQLFVDEVEFSEKQLCFKLAIEKTDCKAKESCGIPEPKNEVLEACCAPGSGCC